MDLKQMIYFKTIVEEGTISKAAKTLHISQPPLSLQLKQLETELDVQLLKRGHRQIELTDAGKIFYKRCIQIIHLSELAKNEMKESYHESLRLGITSSNSALIQLPQITDFIQENPFLSFRVHEGTTYEMIDLLLSHNIDCGIVRTPFDASRVDALYLEKEPMIAIGHQDYFQKNVSCIKDLKDIPLIIHQRYLPLITDYCLNQHFHPFIRLTCDDCRSSLIWATAHYGVAIVPQSALSIPQYQSLQHVILHDKELYTGVAFITRKQENIPQKLQEFIDKFVK